MLKLTDGEIKKLRRRIIQIMTDEDDKTPVDKLNKLIDLYIDQTGDGDGQTVPAHEVPDVNEDDVGDFPTVH
jgi:hypothetical protein